MARQTSIECYNKIKANGTLAKRKLEAMKILIRCGPCTTREAQASISHDTPGWSELGARFGELRDAGVVTEVRQRRCNITGVNVIEWDVTDNMPQQKIVSTKTKPRNLQRCVDYIIEQIDNRELDYATKIFLKYLTKINK